MSGGMAGGVDLNDVDFDAFLSNERTLSDPSVFRVAAGQAVRLRIINGSSSTNYWVDLGSLNGKLIAVDGHGVVPFWGSIFPIAMAQRMDIVVRLPSAGAYAILAQVEGKTDRTGIILATPGAKISKLSSSAHQSAPAVDLSLETRLRTTQPISGRKPDVILPLRLDGDMSRYVWSLNGKYWPDPDVMMVQAGEQVAIDMMNASMMSHPMHLHGHVFQVVAINGSRINGAVRDTVLVPPMGSVRIAFNADNPGRWALHCHNLYHMMGGMMTEVRYPGIV
jgi:FtsP/CotA-like multicopper oxidase with cupredoxin domain